MRIEIEYKETDLRCHECTSHVCDKNGYPVIKREGRSWRVYQYIYWRKTGQKPPVVMHTCDNRRCINPDHLVAGTIKENVKDMMDKGRHVALKGENHGRARLTQDDVDLIRAWISLKYTYKSIGKAFGVSLYAIYEIKSGRRWKTADAMTTLADALISMDEEETQ